MSGGVEVLHPAQWYNSPLLPPHLYFQFLLSEIIDLVKQLLIIIFFPCIHNQHTGSGLRVLL
jgi:hypothetical protein